MSATPKRDNNWYRLMCTFLCEPNEWTKAAMTSSCHPPVSVMATLRVFSAAVPKVLLWLAAFEEGRLEGKDSWRMF